MIVECYACPGHAASPLHLLSPESVPRVSTRLDNPVQQRHIPYPRMVTSSLGPAYEPVDGQEETCSNHAAFFDHTRPPQLESQSSVVCLCHKGANPANTPKFASDHEHSINTRDIKPRLIEALDPEVWKVGSPTANGPRSSCPSERSLKWRSVWQWSLAWGRALRVDVSGCHELGS